MRRDCRWPCARVAGAVLLLTVHACAQRDAATASDPYAVVLAETAHRLHLDLPLRVHPLMGKLDRSTQFGEFRMTTFYELDTLPVFGEAPQKYIQCDLATSGACAPRPGAASIVLSESVDLGRGIYVIIVYVSDLRTDLDTQRYYRARLKKEGTRWAVFRFEEM